jgi:hypothetical protein
VKRSIRLLASTALLLAMAPVAHGDEAGEAHFVFGLSFGPVVPRGHFSEGFSTGLMGAGSLGITGRRFGGRLWMGSIEPRTRGLTNDFYSARLGSAVEVSEAIVPVELQGIAILPSQTSHLAATLHAGAGFHNVTVRRKNTDEQLDDFNRFGFSAGAGLRYRLGQNKPVGTLGLNGVFHGTGAERYFTTQLEFSFVI